MIGHSTGGTRGCLSSVKLGVSGTSLGEARVDERDDLVVAVEALSVIRNRTDAVHSDGSSDGGGDGHGDTGGDGLNIPES